MPIPKQTYDCIVITDQTTGLLAASLLSRRGYRTAVFTSQDTTFSKAKNDWYAPNEPTCIPFIANATRAHAVLKRLELAPPILRESSSRVQLLWPKKRLDFHHQQNEESRREFKRVFGTGAPRLEKTVHAIKQLDLEIDHFLNRTDSVHPRNYWQHWGLKRKTNKDFQSIQSSAEALCKSLDNQSPNIHRALKELVRNNINPNTPDGAVALIRGLSTLLQLGGNVPLLQQETLISQLLVRAREVGIPISPLSEVSLIEGSFGRVKHLRLKDDTYLKARVVVLDSRDPQDLLPHENAKRLNIAQSQKHQNQPFGHLHLIVKNFVIPVGLSNHFFIPSNNDLKAPILGFKTQAEKVSDTPNSLNQIDGYSRLTLIRQLKNGDEKSDKAKAKWTEQIITDLKTLIPFLDDGLEAVLADKITFKNKPNYHFRSTDPL